MAAVVMLHVALQDGFEGDEVGVRVDGRSAWHDRDVRTRTQIGLADSFQLDVPSGPHTVEVEVPTRDTAGSAEVRVEGPTWLAVSLDRDGTVSLERSEQPFHYA